MWCELRNRCTSQNARQPLGRATQPRHIVADLNAHKSREPAVKITRRKFSIGVSASVLTIAGLAAPALAQGPAPAELMAPGPLPEMSLGDAKAPVTIVE